MTIRITDLHCDTALELQGGADLVAGNPQGHVDLRRLEQGGVGLQVFACYIAPTVPNGSAHALALELLDGIDGACARSGGKLAKVETIAEADRALDRGATTAVIAAVENGQAIEEDLAKLERLRSRGARYMTLTHARHLPWAASSGEALGPVAGLTAFGEKVVAAMNEMGMIVDVSHVHETTFWDVVRLSRRPFLASHSNAAAICPTARNLSDDQIRAIAAAGGMIGINFYPGFLDRDYAARQDAELGDLFVAYEAIEREHPFDVRARLAGSRQLAASQHERMAGVRPGVERILDHIQHVTRLVGDDHVGFGSDFDGIPDVPDGAGDCAAFPRILAGLRQRGFTEASLEKIARGNFRRVLEANS